MDKISNFYMFLKVKMHIKLKSEKYHSLLDTFILCPLHFADNWLVFQFLLLVFLWSHFLIVIKASPFFSKGMLTFQNIFQVV